VARAFQRDVALPALVDRIVIAGGSVVGIGDVTASAELNLYLDPPGARHVFRSRTTKTLVPLDIARKVSLTMDLLDKLPAESSRAGRFLRPIMPFLFRTFHQIYGQESILLHRTMAVVATLHPELFDKHEMAGDVETSGELTRGASIFDRRYVPAWRINMEVALDVDAAAARDCIMRGLGEAGRASS
jgi:inosine-uridine nucleoside N-ribohydrolase